METTVELKKTNGTVIYSYTCENNSVAATLKHYLDTHRYEKIDLTDIDLHGADLINIDFCGVNLTRAYLQRANLSYSDLSYCNLRYASMSYAKLTETRLVETNFLCADLRESNFKSAYVRNTNFSRADLRETDFTSAEILFSNFTLADAGGAIFTGAEMAENIFSKMYVDEYTVGYLPVCPMEGSFIGYKKLHYLIVKLLIPADAKRSSATGAKCRCSKAKVLSIEYLDGTPADVTKVYSDYDPEFVYEVGKTVEEPLFDNNRWAECSTGIHFFMHRILAERYN